MNQKEICEIIRGKHALITLIRVLDTVMSLTVVLGYVLLLFIALFGSGVDTLLKLIAISATPFFIISMARWKINAQRPYEYYGIEPLIPRKSGGKAYPSRHAVSAWLIATIAMRFIPILGIALALIALCICISRYITALHFPRDLMAGTALGIICGVLGVLIAFPF